MASGLQFDGGIQKAMENAYLTPDIAAARSKVIDALKLKAGETVLDIGSGLGFLSRDMAEGVGSTGSVQGIDMAQNMVGAAQKLCVDQPWTHFQTGDAMSLPYADASFDVVVTTQVYEYVPDLKGALAEFSRVMRVGGRGVIVDTDWDTVYWSATDHALSDRIISAWSDHCAQARVPLRLAAVMRSADLKIKEISSFPLFNSAYDGRSFSYWMSKIIGDFVVGRNGLIQEEVDAWQQDLDQLGQKGDYFFCLNRYLFEAAK